MSPSVAKRSFSFEGSDLPLSGCVFRMWLESLLDWGNGVSCFVSRICGCISHSSWLFAVLAMNSVQCGPYGQLVKVSLLLHWGYAVLIFVIRGLSHCVLSLGELNSTFRYFQSWSSERRLLVNSSLIPPSPLSKVCDQSAAVGSYVLSFGSKGGGSSLYCFVSEISDPWPTTQGSFPCMALNIIT